MIVADTILIVYFLLNGPHTSRSAKVFDRDSRWIAPSIWYIELLNVLATSVRESVIDLPKAQEVYVHAPAFVKDAEVSALEVLDLSVASRFATFDCYYVVLARKLNTRLVTADRKMIRQFPGEAISIEDFAEGK
jgi:predicted nucleic acid-binding protein